MKTNRTKRFPIVALASLLAVAALCVRPARGQQPPAGEGAVPAADVLTAAEIEARYGWKSWPGATGPLHGGIDPRSVRAGEWRPAKAPEVSIVDIAKHDPQRGTPVLDQAARLRFVLARRGKPAGGDFIEVEVTVTRTREAARVVLLNQFLSLHNMPALSAPNLPWGEVRRPGLGDVAFVNGRGDLLHCVSFVRANVAVRIAANRSGATHTLQLARSVDASIAASPAAATFDLLELPQPRRFELADPSVSPGEVSEIVLDAGALAVDWRLPHGSLVRDVKRRGDLGYICREPGPLHLFVIDERGRFAETVVSVGPR